MLFGCRVTWSRQIIDFSKSAVGWADPKAKPNLPICFVVSSVFRKYRFTVFTN